MSKKVLCMIVVIVVLLVVVGIIQVIKSHEKTEISQGEVPVQNIGENQVEELPQNTEENHGEELAQNTEENQVDETKQSIEESKKTLYFFHDGFVGYLQNNEWKEPTDVLLKDIFDNDYYTVYTNKNEKVTSNKLALDFFPGYKGFYYERSGESEENELAKFATKDKDIGYVFDLPNSLNEDLNKRHTIGLADIEMSGVMLQVDSIENDIRADAYIAFNADYNLKFADETEIKSLPQDIEKTLREWLDSNGLNANSNYYIMQSFNVDLNNDGILDEVYNVTSEDAFLLKTDKKQGGDFVERIDELIRTNGGFSLILTIINDRVAICDSSFLSIKEAGESEINLIGSTESYDVDVVDLNEDGIYEILYFTSGYEYWDCDLAVYDNNLYSKLRSTNN